MFSCFLVCFGVFVVRQHKKSNIWLFLYWNPQKGALCVNSICTHCGTDYVNLLLI